MGLLAKIFGKKNVAERKDEPVIVYVPNETHQVV